MTQKLRDIIAEDLRRLAAAQERAKNMKLVNDRGHIYHVEMVPSLPLPTFRPIDIRMSPLHINQATTPMMDSSTTVEVTPYLAFDFVDADPSNIGDPITLSEFQESVSNGLFTREDGHINEVLVEGKLTDIAVYQWSPHYLSHKQMFGLSDLFKIRGEVVVLWCNK